MNTPRIERIEYSYKRKDGTIWFNSKYYKDSFLVVFENKIYFYHYDQCVFMLTATPDGSVMLFDPIMKQEQAIRIDGKLINDVFRHLKLNFDNERYRRHYDLYNLVIYQCKQDE